MSADCELVVSLNSSLGINKGREGELIRFSLFGWPMESCLSGGTCQIAQLKRRSPMIKPNDSILHGNEHHECQVDGRINMSALTQVSILQ